MIKDFLEKITKKQEEKEEIFLALEIDSEKVITSLWQVKQGKAEVTKLGSLEEWQEEEEESLLLACDASVSKLLEGVLQEPTGIIFGLPESWVKEEEILPSYKKQLRAICEKLALRPLGFVVTTEALMQYLKKEEGVPLSAILVKVNQAGVMVSLVKLGKIKGIQKAGRSEDLGADVEEALARFEEKEILPSRILLFNGLIDFEEARQQLTSFSWQNLNFLHLPKVEILEPRTSIKAIAIAGGSEVAKSLGFKLKTEVEEEAEKPEDLGFVEGEGAMEEKVAETEEVARVEKIEKVARVEKKAIIEKLRSIQPLRFLKRLMIFLPVKLSVFLGAGFCFLVAFSLFLWWRWPKAEITLYLQPKTLKEILKVRLDPEVLSGQPGVIKAEREKIVVEGREQKETTGKKLVGEKAKGEVMIYNKTDGEKVLAKETVLIGPGGLSFVLTEEVKIASRSAEEGGVTYGKTTAQVEAVSIGTESNLEENSKLSIKGFSQEEFSPKTEKGFSGGTSREIRAVSKEDREDLRGRLVKELESKAKEELKEKIGSAREIFEQSLENRIAKEEFSQEEDEEATTLALNLTLESSVLTFSQDDLLFQAKERIQERIPEDFVLTEEGTSSRVLKGEFEEGKGDIEVELEVKLQPKIDFEEIKKRISGKKVQGAEEVLNQIPGLSKCEVKISPLFPGPLARIPYRDKNINIKVKVL